MMTHLSPPLVDDSIAAAPLDPLQPDKAVLGLYGMPSEPGLPLFTVQSLPPHLHVQSLDPVGLPKPGVVQLIKLSLSSTALVRAGSTGSFPCCDMIVREPAISGCIFPPEISCAGEEVCPGSGSQSGWILGLPFTIRSVIVQSARNSERALRAAQLKFMRWSRIPHWRVRADEAKVEALSSVSG